MKKRSDNSDVYKPSWFAYERMAGFLLPIYLTEESSKDAEVVQNTEYENDKQEGRGKRKRTSKSPLQKLCKRRQLTDNETMELRVPSQAQISQPMVVSRLERDTCSIYAELLAMRLREFDEFSRATIINEIDNLMYRAKMRLSNGGSIHGNFSSSIVTTCANMLPNIPHSSCDSSAASSSEPTEEYKERKVF
ncbi:hypothetical protein Trydic_g886 [Trypoxylus dichotomus]